ncbi:vacuolar protein sorting-associated protein 62 [Stagonosporopsis vannaccii]|nr:vacuolar protein sorting-associated protein 62 [Stagonosporopsis vannaccii]
MVRPWDAPSQAAPPPLSIPQYAIDHAPIIRLHPDDTYRPADLSTFLRHVRPQINFKDVGSNQSLSLADLDKCNTHGVKNGQDVYLTSYDDVTASPAWLEGSEIDGAGSTGDDRTGAIIVVEKGSNTVDVFYFVFWAYNYGGVVVGRNLGNHVGDWEHVMVRFQRGVPTTVWLSQHANGEAFTFTALEKNASGKRALVYAAKGSHAIYARAGSIDHTIPNLNTSLPFLLVDQCAAGPVFDPTLTSYVYSYTAPAPSPRSLEVDERGTFAPLTPSSPSPAGWLYFAGRWGDETYPASDPRQSNLVTFHKFEGGPTGPAFKDLRRERVWPANSHAAGQLVRTSLDGSTRRAEKRMEVQGQPRRVFVDGRDVSVDRRKEK